MFCILVFFSYLNSVNKSCCCCCCCCYCCCWHCLGRCGARAHRQQNVFLSTKCILIHIAYYYIDRSILLENTPLVKFIRNYIRDSSGVFSISSLVRISLISLLQSLYLKLFFNSLVYDRNIFGSSSKVFGNLRTSSGIFGNFRKMFGNARVTFGQIFENLHHDA